MDTTKIDDECCPNSRSCNVNGQLRCCSGFELGVNDAQICCESGGGCGHGQGSKCRNPRSQGTCCPGLFCAIMGRDEFGDYGQCVA
jgi:hypothetical protein